MNKKRKIEIASIIILLIVIIFIVVIFNNKINSNNGVNVSGGQNTTFMAYILEQNENNLLVQPAIGEKELKSSDKISVHVDDSNKYEIGEKVEITYDGTIMESYPAKIDLIDIKKCEDTKLEAMYKVVIDKLYNEDTALNSNAKYIALDLDGMQSRLEKNNINSKDFNMVLTDEEKETLLNYYRKYNNNVINADFNKLKEEGLYNEGDFYIEGVLIYISDVKEVNNNKVVLSATKYKSGLGAIFFDLELNYKNNIWEVEVTGFAIS